MRLSSIDHDANNNIDCNDKSTLNHEEHQRTSHMTAHGTDPDYRYTIKWFNVIGMILFHVAGCWGYLLLLSFDVRLMLLRGACCESALPVSCDLDA